MSGSQLLTPTLTQTPSSTATPSQTVSVSITGTQSLTPSATESPTQMGSASTDADSQPYKHAKLVDDSVSNFEFYADCDCNRHELTVSDTQRHADWQPHLDS